MKKILALVLSLMMLVSVACAAGSIHEEAKVHTDSDVVEIVETSEAVKAFTAKVAETELSEIVTAETFAAVTEMVGAEVAVNDVVELKVEEINEEEEATVVTFFLETKFAEGEKVALVFVALDETGLVVLNDAAVEGVGNADGSVTVSIPNELLKTVVENAAHIAVLTVTAK